MRRAALAAAALLALLGRGALAGDDAATAALVARYERAKESVADRCRIVAALGQVRTEPADAALGRVLQGDPAESVRIAAVAALCSRGTEGAARAALDAVRTSDPYVALAVAEGLSRRCPAKVVPWLVAKAGERGADAELRAAALQIVVALGRAEAPKLLHRLVDDGEPLVRAAVASGLARADAAHALPALERLARDEDLRVRVAALAGLGALPGKPAPRLREALAKDAAWQARVAAARALARREATEPLLEVARDAKADVRVRIACLDELSRAPSKAVVADLIATVNDVPGRPDVDRRRALRALTGAECASAAEWRSWWAGAKATYSGPGAPSEEPPRDRTQARFYDLPVESQRVCFLIDGSGSMAGAKFELATKELERALGSLPKGATFGVLVFTDRLIAIQEAPAPASAEVVARVLAELRALRPDGGTDIHGALAALLHASRPHDPQAADAVLFDTAFVVSDGLPTAGAVQDPDELCRRVREWNELAQMRIHTVAIGGEGEALLAALARDSGARHARR